MIYIYIYIYKPLYPNVLNYFIMTHTAMHQGMCSRRLKHTIYISDLWSNIVNNNIVCNFKCVHLHKLISRCIRQRDVPLQNTIFFFTFVNNNLSMSLRKRWKWNIFTVTMIVFVVDCPTLRFYSTCLSLLFRVFLYICNVVELECSVQNGGRAEAPPSAVPKESQSFASCSSKLFNILLYFGS